MPSIAVVAAMLHPCPEPGTVVRIARTAAGWTQAELGQRCGYSASQVSRWETGRLPLRDVALLRTLVDVLDLPPEVFGLTGGDTTGDRAIFNTRVREDYDGAEGGWVRVHLIGKDVVRFHAVYWPAFLMSAGIALPKQVYGHGFLLSRGEKMSKSVGNVVDPMVLADRFGVDAAVPVEFAPLPIGAPDEPWTGCEGTGVGVGVGVVSGGIGVGSGVAWASG